MKIVVLKKKNIQDIFSMKDAINASKDALSLYSKGDADIPLRVNISVDKDSESIYMPGYVPGAEALGIKLVSTYPKNIEIGLDTISSMMILKNHKTGEISSILDGNYLTKLRTGAVAGAATDVLARKDAKIFTLIGTGGQAREQLEAVLNVRDIEEARIVGRDEEKAEEFVDDMLKDFSKSFRCKITMVEDANEAVRDSDIITAVTTSKEPVFDGKLIKEGTHINGIGSFMPDMQEVDFHVLNNSDKIYLDTRDGVLNESGDFIIPIERDKFSKGDIDGELGELLLDKIPGRENDNEITFFNSVGSGVLDLVTAERIYEKAIEKEIGDIIEF
ncbi:MAG TPA: ornithine cyclodeaminase family protein [Tissierellaceae bacterium]|nr:ornithine cyclodeaminase family protein [Tissierellaceae bacterium]